MATVLEQNARRRRAGGRGAYRPLAGRDIAIRLVDQEIRHALKIAADVCVLELGRNKHEGAASELDDLEKAFRVA
ncbi:MAG: hypothetical protein IIA73_10595 [Proteobacteria bacterium]|nr:hypothetical protein [Pseudomonadota bacterium]